MVIGDLPIPVFQRLLAKLQSWENLDHTMGLDLRYVERDVAEIILSHLITACPI